MDLGPFLHTPQGHLFLFALSSLSYSPLSRGKVVTFYVALKSVEAISSGFLQLDSYYEPPFVISTLFLLITPGPQPRR